MRKAIKLAGFAVLAQSIFLLSVCFNGASFTFVQRKERERERKSQSLLNVRSKRKSKKNNFYLSQTKRRFIFANL